MDIALWLLPAVFAVVALVLFRRRRQYVLRGFGLSASRWSTVDVAVGLLVPAVAIALVFLAEWSLGAIRVHSGSISWNSLWTDVIGTLLLAAIAEEVLYRMGLLSGVAALLDPVPAGRWIAVLLTGALFGLAHLQNTGATWVSAVGTGLGGVIYGIAFLATRSIWLPLALHFSWNLSQGLFGFPISGLRIPGILTSDSVGSPALNGAAYGPEAGIPGLLARFFIIAIVFAYVRLRFPEGKVRSIRFAPDPTRPAATSDAGSAGGLVSGRTGSNDTDRPTSISTGPTFRRRNESED
jgi:membrane protease YdiL (CAAX protease family)